MNRKINYVVSKPVIFLQDDIDTDQIIPARFLKLSERVSLADKLFFDWRYLPDGEINSSFVLNKIPEPSQILIAGKNFGCGSSREHAAWAIADFGFRVIVAPSFADIFYNNALNNFILPIQLSENTFQKFLSVVGDHSEVVVDLSIQEVQVPSKNFTASFSIDKFRKVCLLNGMDTVEFLQSHTAEIVKFETRRTNSELINHSYYETENDWLIAG